MSCFVTIAPTTIAPIKTSGYLRIMMADSKPKDTVPARTQANSVSRECLLRFVIQVPDDHFCNHVFDTVVLTSQFDFKM